MVGSKERQLIPGFFTPSPAVSTWLKKITDIVLKKSWHLVAKIAHLVLPDRVAEHPDVPPLDQPVRRPGEELGPSLPDPARKVNL